MATASTDEQSQHLHVHINDRSYSVSAGETFAFGRAGVPGLLGESDSTVSRTHGLISNYVDRWEVTSVGSYVGFLMHDIESAATLEVPVGIGPIGVPFTSVMIVVPARNRYALTVEAPHQNRGHDLPDLGRRGTAAATEQIIPESACFDRNGRMLRWFQVLVALCEPRLLLNSGPVVIPSDAAIRHRLGMGSSSFDRAFSRARTELGFEPYTHLVRVAMMNVAIHQGVVRPIHLDLLPNATGLQSGTETL